jgi:hypothetical protein
MSDTRTSTTRSAESAAVEIGGGVAGWDDLAQINAGASQLRAVMSSHGRDAGLSVLAEEAIVVVGTTAGATVR